MADFAQVPLDEAVHLLLVSQAKARGAADLLPEQAEHLRGVSQLVTEGLAGSERARAHLKAQLSLDAFSTAAEAYLEARAWRLAILDVVSLFLTEAVSVAIGAALQAGAGALQADLEGLV